MVTIPPPTPQRLPIRYRPRSSSRLLGRPKRVFLNSETADTDFPNDSSKFRTATIGKIGRDDGHPTTDHNCNRSRRRRYVYRWAQGTFSKFPNNRLSKLHIRISVTSIVDGIKNDNGHESNRKLSTGRDGDTTARTGSTVASPIGARMMCWRSSWQSCRPGVTASATVGVGGGMVTVSPGR